MIVVKKERIKVFDGNQEECQLATIDVEIDSHVHKIRLSSLIKISESLILDNRIRPDDISTLLGLKITSFDKIKIYHGSKRGLKLFYYPVNNNGVTYMVIFSFGEFQPGRILSYFEAVVR